MSVRGGGGGGGKGNNGISTIPASSRKMVQSLKEIVNNLCTEQEIYFTLKECNMDPDEAVNRLLSQDPFHEVKSKREKKKESKDIPDSRSRGAITLQIVVVGVVQTATLDVAVQANLALLTLVVYMVNLHIRRKMGHMLIQPLHLRHSACLGITRVDDLPRTDSVTNGTLLILWMSNYLSSLMKHGGSQIKFVTLGIFVYPGCYRLHPRGCDSVAPEIKLPIVGTSDGISSSTQSSGFQSTWLGGPGHVSMADIVKMGKPHGKASAVPSPPLQSANHQNVLATSSAAAHHNLHSLQDHASMVSDINTEPGVFTSQQLPPNDEWPAIEPPTSSLPSVVEAPSDTEPYADPSHLPLDRVNRHTKYQLDELQVAEDLPIEMLNANRVGSTSVSSRNGQEDNSGGPSVLDNSFYKEMNSYQPHKHVLEHNEAEDGISSVAANLQQLDLQKQDREAPLEEDNPPVIIPNHLQLHTPDCLNLSFGSFGSGTGTGAAFSGSGSFATRPLTSDLEETSSAADVSSIGHSDSRNPEYYGEEHLSTTSDGNLVHRTGGGTVNYDSPSVSQPEALKQETTEVAQGNQYAFPSSAADFTYENTQQFNNAFTHPQTSSPMQSLAALSNVMQQAYTNSLPSSLLASSVQTAREDFAYSPFPVTQSMPTKYSNVASSISGPTMSMPEALRAGSISTPQPTQTLPGAGVATGPALPQHLAVHPYSQPTLPLGHFANMISYPFLPQSYTYMPSAYQQGFAGNNTYHQSLAAMLPQYKNSVSVSSLPQSAAIPSGYAFGSSTSIPGGNFPLNPPSAPTGTTVGYDDVLSSQYKDSNHLISLQQNDNSAMWVHGPGSRTVSALPSTYYSFQGQNQQPSGYRQGQQPSQQFSYPNYYHSQTGGLSMEHQQQNPRDAASLGASQGQPPKQSQQIWQNSY
ncbi:gbf-interacting protein 1 [Quercus suber]|uniref:Gbf-interacting protein 1 n=1 Tax=Quercus suber TaxID=58331 RepID=A0AAW0KNE6_QUESU